MHRPGRVCRAQNAPRGVYVGRNGRMELNKQERHLLPGRAQSFPLIKQSTHQEQICRQLTAQIKSLSLIVKICQHKVRTKKGLQSSQSIHS